LSAISYQQKNDRQPAGRLSNAAGKEKKGGNTMKIIVDKTKKGYPAYWEAGGGHTNTGYATIITGKEGQPKKAVYVRGRGELANSEHALIILEVGDHIIEANQHRRDFFIKISKILGFETSNGEIFALIEQINCFSESEWDKELPAYLQAAVQAAVEKATCYHCREPHFIK